MMLPIQISIRNLPPSPAIEDAIRKKAQKLEQFYDRMTSCRVIVDISQKHKHKGKLYEVHIDITVPGKELVVTHKKNEDVYIAIRDAFSALTRQLESHASKQKGYVKKHEAVLHGQVARLIQHDGYGFIDGSDGNEYYFSMTNVGHPHFDELEIGDLVEYTSVVLGDGRQANHVIRG
ncbi:MAG TPA: ribosome-associated translation inhibitor RaiA, partial [Myxococcota bacterium]|nr:ribosome-associated translation inhibitor RaiA [Myxococcota bacterium]